MEKVYLAVCGKFYTFALATQYAKLGRLGGLYVADQRISPPKGVAREQYHNRIDIKLWRLLASHSPFKFGHSHKRENQIFDPWLYKELSKLDGGILHAWNSHVSTTIKKLDPAKWLKCIERACPYNKFQYDLVMEESRRIGVPCHEDPAELERKIEELYDADVITVPSHYTARSYTDPVLVKKLRINPLGGNYACKERQPKTGNLRVLMVGNSFLRKGTHYLIEAFKLIKDPQAELWIRGSVPDDYRRRITDPRIKIIPTVLRKKLMSLYEQATVFCLPSVDEGFGMVGLEAISLGLPVIYTDNCGVGDVLDENTGIRVPIRSPEALAAAIMRIADWKTENYEKFDVARKRILAENTWEACAKRMLADCYKRS